MQFYRITFKQMNGDEPAPLVITIPLNEKNMVAQEIPFAGWWGKISGNNWCRPIIFMPNGRVDFGGDPDYSNEDRYGKMPLFEKTLEIGTSLYAENFDEDVEVEFRVKEIIALA